MVDAARKCGADFIKFQCYVTDSFIAPGSPLLPIFKGAELSLADYRRISRKSQEAGITLIATAIDLDGLAMIKSLDLPIVKIDSTNITNLCVLRAISETRKPVFLSTGASNLGEIERALMILRQGTTDITLFHCTVQYPADDDNLNLRALKTMAAAFPDAAIGYSDHSKGIVAAVAAVALGARVLEKHFTLDNNMPGPDHQFSSDPAAFAEYVTAIRRLEQMLGDGRKAPVPVEELPRRRGRRYVTAMQDLAEGDVLSARSIRSRRVNPQLVDPIDSLSAEFEEMLPGWRVKKAMAAGTPLRWSNLISPDKGGS
ncbi:MAG: N-acetylneuraminate synthase family protein [Dongiaceae bacterium]